MTEPEPIATTYVFKDLAIEDVLDLMSGYVNLKVKGMCALVLSDQDQLRADRPYRARQGSRRKERRR
jgi:hypothetical protein